MNELAKLKEALKDNHVLLTGGGGVGKSYLTIKLIEDYKKNKKQVVILGSTGISAVNINGQTIHSFFAFGICANTEELLRHDRYNKQRIVDINKILTLTDLLIIDEISMVSASMMEMIRYRLNVGNFKGALLFVGDFFQLPPIVSKQSSDSLFCDELYAFESSAWKNYSPVIIELLNSKRTKDKQFFSFLKKIREGTLNQEIVKFLDKLRENKNVYKNSPTILYGRNREADIENEKRLEQIDEEVFLLKANEEIFEKSLHEKRVQSWQKSLTVQNMLKLKVSAHVLFCANKWGQYYNGEHGVIREICDDYILVEKQNSLVKVFHHEFVLYENIFENGELKSKPLASMKQFPLKLSYAITIHKSQGMSIENLVCDIHNIFEKSQFYVAISRAKSAQGLCICYNGYNFEEHLKKCLRVNEKVSNFYLSNRAVFIEDSYS